MFTFAQSSGIDDTMFRLVEAHTAIRGVLDHGQGVQTWAATEPLKAAGVELFDNKAGTGVRKVHHKLMVIDERLIIAGSFNYTAPGHHAQRREHRRPRRPRGGRPRRRGRPAPASPRTPWPRSTASSPPSPGRSPPDLTAVPAPAVKAIHPVRPTRPAEAVVSRGSRATSARGLAPQRAFRADPLVIGLRPARPFGGRPVRGRSGHRSFGCGVGRAARASGGAVVRAAPAGPRTFRAPPFRVRGPPGGPAGSRTFRAPVPVGACCRRNF